MHRRVQPEILDSLPADHPDARHSRRDLRLVNRIMGNHPWLARTLLAVLRPGERAIEIGAGTGELGRRMAPLGIAIDGLDFAPRPAGWPQGQAWHRADLQTFDGYGRYSAVIGNLIFHQFDDLALARLGGILVRTTRVVVASEPARSRLSLALVAGFGRFLGANRVTRHDAPVSIAAGFLRDELPRALGLAAEDWNIDCRTSAFGAYRMKAVRR